MRRYETTVIVDPDVSDDERKAFVAKIGELIPRHEGFLLTVDDWGNRKLAYEIKRKMRGHYYRFDFCGNGACVDEMERSFRIDDRSLKYMTVLLDQDADLEALKEEMARAQEEARVKAEEDAKAKAEAKAADEAKAAAAAAAAKAEAAKAQAAEAKPEEPKEEVEAKVVAEAKPAEVVAPVEAETPKADSPETETESAQEENKDAKEV